MTTQPPNPDTTPPMPSTKTQRWLDLIAFLAGRRVPVTFEEIMQGVPPYAADWADADETAQASVRRKFERDKNELRGLGIPIETVDYTINFGVEQAQGYLLRARDFYLPYLRLISDQDADSGDRSPAASQRATPVFELGPDEARAAVEALRRVAELPSFPFRREARSALRKLTFDLDPAVVSEDPGAAPLRYLDPPGSADVRDRLHALTDALLRRKEVAFGYYAIHRDSESERRVRPYGLLFQHSWWYLVGYDLDRSDERVFRVGRMKEVSVNPRRAKTADYEVPESFDLDRWAGRPPWALPGQDEEEPLEVVVHFDFPRSLWADRNHHGELVEKADDGSQRRAFRVRDPDPFLRWLLTLRGEVRVESPPELEERRRDLLQRVAALHG